MTATYEITADAALDVAERIGYGIARRALWAGERCTWLDAIPVMPGMNPATSTTSGAEPYGGTSGIGLFLAQLAARVDEPLLKKTALGALRHASTRADTHERASPVGFYGGAAGIGACLVLAGRELADGASVDAGRALLMRVALEVEHPDATDVIGGTAGTVLALAVAARALGDDAALLARAREAAEKLLARGMRDARGTLSWSTMQDKRANLTGFAHGAAGIAHALLALHALAPDPVLHEAVVAAFAYERGTFDPAYANWPDFRVMPGQPAVAPSFAVAWCHGAVGIVRSRLFAEAAGSFAVADEIDAALRTTAAQAEMWHRDPNADFTLCHGVFGMVDALLDGVRSGRTAYGPLAGAIVAAATDRYHRAELPWPSGLMSREQVDGLMLGTAGIGHVYLRIADPSLEPILAPGRPRASHNSPQG
jgi:lantibiotic biosynthesis protein